MGDEGEDQLVRNLSECQNLSCQNLDEPVFSDKIPPAFVPVPHIYICRGDFL